MFCCVLKLSRYAELLKAERHCAKPILQLMEDCSYAEHHCAECHVLMVIKLINIMKNVIVLSVAMLDTCSG